MCESSVDTRYDMKIIFHNPFISIIYFIVTKFVVIRFFDLHVQYRMVLKFIFRFFVGFLAFC